jgi:hypothetical protein
MKECNRHVHGGIQRDLSRHMDVISNRGPHVSRCRERAVFVLIATSALHFYSPANTDPVMFANMFRMGRTIRMMEPGLFLSRFTSGRERRSHHPRVCFVTTSVGTEARWVRYLLGACLYDRIACATLGHCYGRVQAMKIFTDQPHSSESSSSLPHSLGHPAAILW